jgi:hypothetical protein
MCSSTSAAAAVCATKHAATIKSQRRITVVSAQLREARGPMLSRSVFPGAALSLSQNLAQVIFIDALFSHLILDGIPHMVWEKRTENRHRKDGISTEGIQGIGERFVSTVGICCLKTVDLGPFRISEAGCVDDIEWKVFLRLGHASP